MSNLCNSVQTQRTSEDTITHRPCSRVCSRDHTYSDPARTVMMNSNNDPLQDYIRRCLAARNLRLNQNCHGRVVYSILSTELHISEVQRTSMQRSNSNTYFDGMTRRPYIVLHSQVRCNTSRYQPYVLPSRRFIGSGVIKSQVEKKQHGEDGSIPLSKNRFSNKFERLDFIELYIARNTNQLGYVILDENILEELSIAINECLSERIPANETKFKPIYEPISPAENSEDNEDD